jgi:transcriptional regulator with XRE-family HTH domain
MATRNVTTQSARLFGNLLLMASIEPEEIGKRIKAAREAKHWTQLEFAMKASVSPATIQRWESGKLPRVRELLRAAQLLDVPAEELVESEVVTERDEETNARLARIEQVLEELVVRLERDDQTQEAGEAQ